MRVIVTRPATQAAPWVQRLRELGLEAAALPLIEILPPDDPAPLQAAWRELPGVSLAMFVSANAAQHFFAARPAGSAWPADALAGSTGPGTSQALLELGVPVSQLVEPAADASSLDSEALWARLRGRDWSGRRVLVVRGEQGRDWLAETLGEAGAVVSFVAAYRRVPARLDEQARALLGQALADPAAHLWHFSSSEAARHLREQLNPQELRQLGQARALATHPRIAQTLAQIGFGHVVLVGQGPQAVLEATQALARRGPPIQSPPP